MGKSISHHRYPFSVFKKFTESEDNLLLLYQFYFGLSDLSEALRSLKLTTPQYAVLSVIEQNPGISNANLARLSFVTAQTMHGIISNLEKRDLIERSCDPVHGRTLCTKLTKQGRHLIKKAKVIVGNTEAVMTKNIKRKDIVLLKKILMQCVDNLTS